jgi:gluconokinase
MKQELILGVDLGTTHCKAIVVNPQGKELSNGSATYPLHTPQPTWVEQDPEELWQGLTIAISEALKNLQDPGSVRALVFSAAMHGVMVIDQKGNPLTRCFIWADHRSASQAETIRQQIDAHALFQRTGCPVQHIYLPAKILWLRQQQPKIFKQAFKFISIKEFVLQRLTGQYLTDKALASTTGLLNTHQLDWDDEILDLVDIKREQLPELVSPEAVLQNIKPEQAKNLGLPPRVAHIPGGSDGGLANIGVGAVGKGQVASTVGTSGAVRTVTQKPYLDPQERTWCYLLTDNHWLIGGAINNGGLALNWFRDRFFSEAEEVDYKKFHQLAQEVELGAEGLIFLPYLAGERNPHWNAKARGVLFGLSLRHERKHVARAILEGVCFCMNDILQALEGAVGKITEIRATGGITYAHHWVQMLADVYGYPVTTVKTQASASQGAVLLAMKALGYFDNLAEVQKLIPIKKTYQPHPKRHQRYQDLHQLFQKLYRHLEKDFDILHKLTTKVS